MRGVFFRIRIIVSALLLAICVCGCGVPSPHAGSEMKGDTIAMQYAGLLQMVDCDSFMVADVKNPWGRGLLQRYLLVPRSAPLPRNLPHGTVLRTPLDNMLVFSTVHAHLLHSLGASAAIGGVCDSRYMLSPFVREGVDRGTIVDCGSTLNVDVERVVQLSPSAILVLPFENGGYGKIEGLPFPMVECAEYMESSPLAAAEWMRFYGRLVGRASAADSLFAAVCGSFEQLRSLVTDTLHRPSLLCELKSNSAWYMPAGGSTMGQMYQMAGARYLFAHCEGSGSVPLSFETVLNRAAAADLWLIKYNSDNDKTYSSLLADFGGYAHFVPFKERNIYACNTGKKPFYEETPFRPDLLLRELVAIFHPQLLPSYKLRYYEKLQE